MSHNSFFYSPGDVEQGSNDRVSQSVPALVHCLGNKLVPIMVHAELGLTHCHDSRIRKHFEKILFASQEARDIVFALQRHVQLIPHVEISGEH